MKSGHHEGAPRYRNPNNILIFRHRLHCSKEIGITRETCLPVNELEDENIESRAICIPSSLGCEVSQDAAMDFPRLVKNSLQAISLDRKARVPHYNPCFVFIIRLA